MTAQVAPTRWHKSIQHASGAEIGDHARCDTAKEPFHFAAPVQWGDGIRMMAVSRIADALNEDALVFRHRPIQHYLERYPNVAIEGGGLGGAYGIRYMAENHWLYDYSLRWSPHSTWLSGIYGAEFSSEADYERPELGHAFVAPYEIGGKIAYMGEEFPRTFFARANTASVNMRVYDDPDNPDNWDYTTAPLPAASGGVSVTGIGVSQEDDPGTVDQEEFYWTATADPTFAETIQSVLSGDEFVHARYEFYSGELSDGDVEPAVPPGGVGITRERYNSGGIVTDLPGTPAHVTSLGSTTEIHAYTESLYSGVNGFHEKYRRVYTKGREYYVPPTTTRMRFTIRGTVDISRYTTRLAYNAEEGEFEPPAYYPGGVPWTPKPRAQLAYMISPPSRENMLDQHMGLIVDEAATDYGYSESFDVEIPSDVGRYIYLFLVPQEVRCEIYRSTSALTTPPYALRGLDACCSLGISGVEFYKSEGA